MVMIWYHPLNEPPHYDAICIDELLGDRFEFRGAYRYPNIHMHLQEFAENAADVQHFQPLHGQMLIPWTDFRVPHVFVHHQASLEFSPDQPHIAYFYDTAMIRLFGKKYQSTKVDASITFYGPGGITLFRFDGEFGRLYLFHTHTPTDYTELDVEFRAYVERKIPRLLNWYIIGNWIAQWRRDIIVWENKV
jgi:cholesterol 7-dehydrogenase